MKKLMTIIICLLLLTGCNKTTKNNDNNIKTDEVKVNNEKDIPTHEYGSLIKYSEIFEDKNIINDNYLNTNSLGKNSVTIFYNENGNKQKINYTYNVIDTTSPLIWLGKNYTIMEGDEENLLIKVMTADNYDKKPNCKVDGLYDPNIPGTYPLSFICTDSSNNKEQVDFDLTVKSKEKQQNTTTTTSTETEPPKKLLFSDVYNEYKNDDVLVGIDVSRYQGDINWKEVKEDGVEFAIIRLGWQADFDSDELGLDAKYIQNIEGALENDIKVGVYFYSFAKTKSEGKKQAEFVLENIKDYNVELPIAFDWENFKHWNNLNMSMQDLRNTSYAFQDVIYDAGYTPVQYGSKTYLNIFWKPIKYQTWLAHYLEFPYTSDYDGEYIMWQLSNQGRVNGINGDVDIDLYYIKK